MHWGNTVPYRVVGVSPGDPVASCCCPASQESITPHKANPGKDQDSKSKHRIKIATECMSQHQAGNLHQIALSQEPSVCVYRVTIRHGNSPILIIKMSSPIM